MAERQPGYYAVIWTDFADVELRNCRPGPLVGEWDGKYWWFTRMDAYRFDCEVEVIGELIEPRQIPIDSRKKFRSRVAV
jgi:hypothetical protein